MNKQTTSEILTLLKGPDFLKIGQAITHNQWEAAMLCVRRLEKRMSDLELDSFSRSMQGLKYAIQRKNLYEAKQALSIMITKRVQLINQLSDRCPSLLHSPDPSLKD